jgi:hypothetical protein
MRLEIRQEIWLELDGSCHCPGSSVEALASG